MGSNDTNTASVPAREVQSPPQSPSKPKMFHIPPPAEPVSWSGTRQAALIALAVVVAAFFFHQALVMFTGGVGPHEDEVIQTFAMIKPDCIKAGYKDEIIRRIKSEGYRVVRQADMTLNRDTVEEFYREHENSFFYTDVCDFLTSGPVTALVLEKRNALKDWRALIGPTDAHRAKEFCPDTCLRAVYGTDSQANCLHGSDSRKGAEREIQLVFKGEKVPTEEAK